MPSDSPSTPSAAVRLPATTASALSGVPVLTASCLWGVPPIHRERCWCSWDCQGRCCYPCLSPGGGPRPLSCPSAAPGAPPVPQRGEPCSFGSAPAAAAPPAAFYWSKGWTLRFLLPAYRWHHLCYHDSMEVISKLEWVAAFPIQLFAKYMQLFLKSQQSVTAICWCFYLIM